MTRREIDKLESIVLNALELEASIQLVIPLECTLQLGFAEGKAILRVGMIWAGYKAIASSLSLVLFMFMQEQRWPDNVLDDGYPDMADECGWNEYTENGCEIYEYDYEAGK